MRTGPGYQCDGFTSGNGRAAEAEVVTLVDAFWLCCKRIRTFWDRDRFTGQYCFIDDEVMGAEDPDVRRDGISRFEPDDIDPVPGSGNRSYASVSPVLPGS